MITVIRKANVYAPEALGERDVLVVGDKIGAIGENLSIDVQGMDVMEIDAGGKVLVPGFIDAHVHILGGGGEGGFRTRTPEIVLSDIISAGVTTVCGLLGTDGVTRNMTSLVAKARGLEEEGVSTYIYVGSYRIPAVTITGDVMTDIMMIDKAIGIGELALSDHRSSHPSLDEFKKLASDARVGGMLSGKAGVVHVHMGDGKEMLGMIRKTLKETEIPITQFYPTHCSRNPEVLDDSIAFAKEGGTIDMTPTSNPEFWEKLYGEIRAAACYKKAIDEGVSEDNITFSSDGQGSLPVFNEKRECIGVEFAKSECIFMEVGHMVKEMGIPMEKAIKTITSNPARILKLTGKGQIQEGFDADICLLDEETLSIDTVLAKGKVMVQNKKVLQYGTFERQ